MRVALPRLKTPILGHRTVSLLKETMVLLPRYSIRADTSNVFNINLRSNLQRNLKLPFA